MGYVYQIRNITKPGIYIGSTNNIKNRWRQHLSSLARGDHHSLYLQRSWNKYGKDSFVFEIIETPDDEETRDREQWWLDFRAQNPNGISNYNVFPLACGGRPGWMWTEEQRKHMSKTNRGRRHTDECKKRMQTSHALNNQPVDLKSPDGVIFKNVTNLRAFARTHGLTSTALAQVVRMKLQQHKGWTRFDRPYVLKTYAFKSPDGIVFYNINRCDVFCLEHNLCRKQMSAVHTGKIKSHQGWTKYVNDDDVV